MRAPPCCKMGFVDTFRHSPTGSDLFSFLLISSAYRSKTFSSWDILIPRGFHPRDDFISENKTKSGLMPWIKTILNLEHSSFKKKSEYVLRHGIWLNFSSDNPALKLMENKWGWKKIFWMKTSQRYLVPKKGPSNIVCLARLKFVAAPCCVCRYIGSGSGNAGSFKWKVHPLCQK